MRKTPLKRSTKPIPRSAPKKTNPARRRKNHLRAYGPPGYVEWCKAQPCGACGAIGYSEVAHIKTGGTGRKDDWTRTVPLCGPRGVFNGCHRILHQHGREHFEYWRYVNLDKLAELIQERWRASLGSSQGGET